MPPKTGNYTKEITSNLLNRVAKKRGKNVEKEKTEQEIYFDSLSEKEKSELLKILSVPNLENYIGNYNSLVLVFLAIQDTDYFKQLTETYVDDLPNQYVGNMNSLPISSSLDYEFLVGLFNEERDLTDYIKINDIY